MTRSTDAPLRKAVDGFLREVADSVPRLHREGAGLEVLGPVAGRAETEDVEIGIDRLCEDILVRWLQRAGVPIDLYSEHGARRVGATGAPPRYIVACDPFDGSEHFMRGMPAEWWSVLTIWGAEDLTPLLAGAVDIVRGELYLADGSGVTVEALDSGERTAVAPAKETGLSDRSIVAAYLMSPRYLSLWTRHAAGLLETMERSYPKSRLWADGGACSYPWLARGLTHAYVMFDEPRSEIDPGLGFAWAAGTPVYSIGEDGGLTKYRFLPGEGPGRVPWLVAACTRELAEDIVGEILRGRGRNRRP